MARKSSVMAIAMLMFLGLSVCSASKLVLNGGETQEGKTNRRMLGERNIIVIAPRGRAHPSPLIQKNKLDAILNTHGAQGAKVTQVVQNPQYNGAGVGNKAVKQTNTMNQILTVTGSTKRADQTAFNDQANESAAKKAQQTNTALQTAFATAKKVTQDLQNIQTNQNVKEYGTVKNLNQANTVNQYNTATGKKVQQNGFSVQDNLSVGQVVKGVQTNTGTIVNKATTKTNGRVTQTAGGSQSNSAF